MPAHRTCQLRRCRRCNVAANASTGLFYSTSTGKTADIADVIKEKLPDAEGPFEVAEVEADFSKYDNVIVGAPTWNTDADTDRSGTAWDEMTDMGALSGTKVAVFGLGDQSGCVLACTWLRRHATGFLSAAPTVHRLDA